MTKVIAVKSQFSEVTPFPKLPHFTLVKLYFLYVSLTYLNDSIAYPCRCMFDELFSPVRAYVDLLLELRSLCIIVLLTSLDG